MNRQASPFLKFFGLPQCFSRTSLLLFGILTISSQNIVQSEENKVTAKEDKPVVACVGDSITAGDSHYPGKLQELLGDRWIVKNFGRGGRTLLRRGDNPYWNEKVYKEALGCNPNIVVIMLGTNDTKPQNWVHKDEFYSNYKELVQSFKALPSKPRIFVCLPCWVAPKAGFGINEENILLEIPSIMKVAAEEGAQVIDVHGAVANHPELLVADGVHPKSTGSDVLANTVYNALKTLNVK